MVKQNKTKQKNQDVWHLIFFFYKWNMRHGLALGYTHQMQMMIRFAPFEP